MKYRVMDSEGTLADFPTEAQARALFNARKTAIDKVPAKVEMGVERIPFVHIHRCHHKEDGTSDRPCEPPFEVYQPKKAA